MPLGSIFRKAGDVFDPKPKRKFGQEAILNGKPVRWGGEHYQWQSPESFATIDPPGSYGPSRSLQVPEPAVTPQEQALGDTLSYAEGTWDEQKQQPDYSMRYGDKPGEGSLDITAPHPRDVRQSAYGSGFASNASGAYQFKDDTWEEMHGGVNAPMTPENQINAVNQLAEQQGYDHDLGFAEQTDRLSGRWASIPNADGVSDYDQPVPHTAQELEEFYNQRRQALERARRLEVYQSR